MEVNYRYKSKHEKTIEEICTYILDCKYGDTITYYDLSKIASLNLEILEQKNIFKNIMYKVKNLLINYGYILKSVSNIGYYILKPKQIPSYTFRTYILNPQKMYEKASKILEKTDKNYLKNKRLEELQNSKELVNNIISTTDNVIYNSNYFKNKTLYDGLND